MNDLTKSNKVSLALDVFAGGGEMGELMRDSFGDASRTHDWSQTSLGSVENWPQSLKTSIQIILGSRYPMFIWWGQELLNFYNDAYIPVLGKRHPKALGESARDIWAELWHSVGPQAEDVLNRGKPSWNEEFLEIMERNGYPEETYFTFSYSPISNDDGGVGGVFCACTEDTRRVVDDRRLRTLRELGAETAKAKTVDEACNISTSVLANNPHDIPFALIYLLERESQQTQLASTTGLAVGTVASPKTIELSVALSADCWSLNQVLATGESRIIENLVDRFGLLPGGAWSESPNSAIVLPLTGAGQEILGFLIVGISPFRPFDDDYQGFFDLVAGQVTTAVTNALYEQERKGAEALAELDQAKIAFFSNVSHEFRTPLTLMLNPLEQVIAQQLPDLVLTDVMMPELDGFQLLSVLRADPKTKGIPIILLSARAGEEAAIEGLQAGADDYLIKPFSAQELIARVDSHLQMARLRQELSFNRFTDEFLATVTHELHAPLVVILGWIRLLRLKVLDEATVLRALDTMERSAKNQAKLIEDLLDISNIISGKVSLQRQPVKLTDIIEEVINTISSNAQAKGINIATIQATSQQGDISVLGDFLRLQQIVRELLDNAIKFTPKGGVIEIQLNAKDSLATLQIKDTGVGISAEFLPHVFDRFTQAEVPSRHSPGGLGLGLAIARQLIQLHGGTIEATSEGEQRGATFTVKLPLI